MELAVQQILFSDMAGKNFTCMHAPFCPVCRALLIHLVMSPSSWLVLPSPLPWPLVILQLRSRLCLFVTTGAPGAFRQRPLCQIAFSLAFDAFHDQMDLL